jgi:hypothetical protein
MHFLLGDTNVQDIKLNTGNLIFMCCFFLALIAVGIWWLRRG